MAKVVEMHGGQPGGLQREERDAAAEVPAPQWLAAGGGEDQAVIAGLGEFVQMGAKGGVISF